MLRHTPTNHPSCTLVQQLFELQAEQHPKRVVAIAGEEEIPYDLLDRRANQLAHYLQELGVGPETLVGIHMGRSLERLIAVLAILKAGGAYVPFDPAYPKERLAFMLHDAGVGFMLTERHLARGLPPDVRTVVCVDSGRRSIDQMSTARPVSNLVPENLAYVIYTSGSTGRPKGVQISHAAVTNLLFSMQQHLRLTASDIGLAVASLSFDMSVLDLFLPLSIGASVVIVDRDSAVDGKRLLAQLKQKKATYLHATPSTWRLLIDAGWQGTSDFRIFCGGDALPFDLAQQLLPRGQRVWNFYGPTETTVYSAIHRIRPDDDRILIGGPLANTQFRIMNGLQPADPGQTGELCIGGAGLSRGYLNRPDLTAERFVPDPFSSEPGARLYRTGDVARVTAEGGLEVLGRIDHQVKVRGFRIELGEIETVLAQQPAVKECVVLARTDRSGDTGLVAYVVAESDNQPAVGELQSQLRQRLPEYMVPAVFVFLDVLPLTANGKVDRLALAARERIRPNVDATFVAPRTPTEIALQKIWKQTLDLDQVGINDNFFQLGGHSLIATRVVSQVRELFAIELPICDIFASPTIAQLAVVIDNFDKRESQLLPRIPVASRSTELPLSFPQERVWFIEQLFPQNLAYNFQSTLRLKGALNLHVLERSLNEIVRRHEIYRTTFPSVDGHPVQVIHNSLSVSVPVIDVSSLPEIEREDEAKRQIAREIRQPFSVTQLPLIRWVLIRVDNEDHILVHIEHHLVHDGWSFNVFLTELLKLYTGFATGQPPQLPDLPIQFADFAQWQRHWLPGEVAETQLRFWRNKLQGSPLVLELPTDRSRPALQSFRGTSLRIELPLELCESLRAISQKHSVTLFMTLLAIFQILLERYTNQQQFVVGSGIANRRWPETETMIGMLVNTIALRADMSGDPSFPELLNRVRETTIEAYANQDLPFEQVVHSLQGQRDLSRNPLFQVMFNFHDASLIELKLPGLSLDLVEVVSNGSAKFDLNVIVIPRSEQQVGSGSRRNPEGITVIWEYNTDLFDETTIQKMIESYVLLMEQVVNDSQRRISSLHLTSEPELRELLFDWNNNVTDYPEKSIAQLFEDQVDRSPKAIALIFENETVTYAELNRFANQLAHYLRAHGVGPETRVGICVERSIDMVVGLLGILKAGGAYLPLDPNYPAERLAYMLQDAEPSLLLTQKKLLSQLPKTGLKAVCLDADRVLIGRESSDNPRNETELENLAYVMYTSGSTGYPKGVSVTQRNVVRLVKENNYASLNANEVFLQFAPLTFDASTLEVWGPLLNGGRLVIFPPYVPTLEELGRTIEENRITTLWLTAGLFHQLVDERPQSLAGVRQLLAGGDVLSVPHVEKALRFMNGNHIINGYGPTENTTFTCCHLIKSSGYRSIPIGRPLANTQVYVLDRNYQPVPVGVAGELYVGGDGLARGYLNRPDQTAEKFIPNMFSAQPGARLYRTGDLVRYLASGELEFIRRVDQQVKIRGFRIEPAEIEYVLGQHAGVAECVVSAGKDPAGEKFLAAYVVAGEGLKLEVSELRGFLRERLPEYMVPASFVFMDALPLTANGKVNRKALPIPGDALLRRTGLFVGPRTATERVLSEIWARVLHLESVGVTDNFFELGGNSLKATRVMSRVRSMLNVELPLRALFEAPAIADFARIVENGDKTESRRKVPAILPVSRTWSRVEAESLDATIIPKS